MNQTIIEAKAMLDKKWQEREQDIDLYEFLPEIGIDYDDFSDDLTEEELFKNLQLALYGELSVDDPNNYYDDAKQVVEYIEEIYHMTTADEAFSLLRRLGWAFDTCVTFIASALFSSKLSRTNTFEIENKAALNTAISMFILEQAHWVHKPEQSYNKNIW